MASARRSRAEADEDGEAEDLVESAIAGGRGDKPEGFHDPWEERCSVSATFCGAARENTRERARGHGTMERGRPPELGRLFQSAGWDGKMLQRMEDSGCKPDWVDRASMSLVSDTGRGIFRSALSRVQGTVGGAGFSRFLSLAAGAGESRTAGGPSTGPSRF